MRKSLVLPGLFFYRFAHFFAKKSFVAVAIEQIL